MEMSDKGFNHQGNSREDDHDHLLYQYRKSLIYLQNCHHLTFYTNFDANRYRKSSIYLQINHQVAYLCWVDYNHYKKFILH